MGFNLFARFFVIIGMLWLWGAAAVTVATLALLAYLVL